MQKTNRASVIPDVLKSNEQELVDEWIREQLAVTSKHSEFVSESALRQPCKEFINALQRATQGGFEDVNAPAWADVRSFLADLSRSRALQGFSPTETAMFVFSFKKPLFSRLEQVVGKRPETLAEEVWNATQLLDKLGVYTTEVYQRSREEVIRRQQQEMLELSTPVIKIWDGVLAIPLIGTLDSARTQLIMENLLETIVETNSKIAILDITGVPTVDTQTAQHLIKTVSAARLMGAECIISGIRPQIAQTIVHLGIEIADVTTKASMADAVQIALARQGWETRRMSS
jgi:rsbT co-antagonist protein RsbR